MRCSVCSRRMIVTSMASRLKGAHLACLTRAPLDLSLLPATLCDPPTGRETMPTFELDLGRDAKKIVVANSYSIANGFMTFIGTPNKSHGQSDQILSVRIEDVLSVEKSAD
jgi:hypothetical protein